MSRFNDEENNNVGAFSIMEAIVGMAITAIIMGIIFVIFSIMSEQMLDFKNQNEFTADMNRLTYSINKDIFENEKMSVLEEGIVFNGYSGNTVSYLVQEEYFLRMNEIFTDTFHININGITLDSVKSNSGKIIFRKLKLNLKVNEEDIDLKFYKQVYANELLEEKSKNELRFK